MMIFFAKLKETFSLCFCMWNLPDSILHRLCKFLISMSLRQSLFSVDFLAVDLVTKISLRVEAQGNKKQLLSLN